MIERSLLALVLVLCGGCGDPCAQKCREWGQFVTACQDAVDNVNLPADDCYAGANAKDIDTLIDNNFGVDNEDIWYSDECENGRQARKSCKTLLRATRRMFAKSSKNQVCGEWGDWEPYIMEKDCDGFVVFVTSNR